MLIIQVCIVLLNLLGPEIFLINRSKIILLVAESEMRLLKRHFVDLLLFFTVLWGVISLLS